MMYEPDDAELAMQSLMAFMITKLPTLGVDVSYSIPMSYRRN